MSIETSLGSRGFFADYFIFNLAEARMTLIDSSVPDFPEPDRYEYDEEESLDTFASLGRGELGGNHKIVVDVNMGTLDAALFDIDNIDLLVSMYPQVYSAAETLIANVNNHSGGDITVGRDAYIFLMHAQRVMAEQQPPQKPDSQQTEVLSKLISKYLHGHPVQLDEKQVRLLGPWLQKALSLVIPGDKSPEALSTSAESANQRFQTLANKVPDQTLTGLGGRSN